VQLRFFEEFDGARNFFGQTVLLAAGEALDGARLQTALQEIWLHHDALRSNFSNAGGAWTQRIPEAVSSVPFCCVDCRTGDLPALTASLYAEMNLETGPLFRAVLCRIDAGERLLLVAHHLVIDGVSWRIVLEDLATAYLHSAPLPAKTTAFTNWSRSLRDPAIAAATRFSRPAVFSWPAVDENRGRSCRARECGVFSMKLSKALTAELLESAHRAYSTEANDLLLTALARAACLQSERMSTAILLEGHGREPLNPAIDVSRTVGWFTALYPVLLDLENTEDPGRHIKLVKEALRAIPHKGLGYGIARYIERDPRLKADPGLVFNYLGQFGGDSESGLFRRASEDTGPMADPDASFPHDVEINALASGGILEFHFSYNPNRSGKEAVAALADSFLRELETLAEHTRERSRTELTPSDTDYDGFCLDEMESFLDQLSAAKGN
jgi:non-ribosomal peptide synthase protein (TIGR01720 family)